MNSTKPKVDTPFPKLMINDDKSIVVYFTDITTGMLLWRETNDYLVTPRMEIFESWMSTNFKDFNGQIILEN